jgi:hypothetical protein
LAVALVALKTQQAAQVLAAAAAAVVLLPVVEAQLLMEVSAAQAQTSLPGERLVAAVA